jgi:hypothetical protein
MKQLTNILEGFGSAVQLLFQSCRYAGTRPAAGSCVSVYSPALAAHGHQPR